MIFSLSAKGQSDTIRIMAYNVLYYGDRPACQGGHNIYHNYLKTIVAYCNPDILGLEKVAAIPMFTGDNSGTAPKGFADSILKFSLDSAYVNRYNYCGFSNNSGADNISLLFYNKNKFGFSGIVASYSNVTDFNTYKLFYKTSKLLSGDTIFLYVVLNHTQSGNSATVRNGQIHGEMSQLSGLFTSLPNMVNMGDFNTHNSNEGCYQTLVAPSDPAFAFSDPPFHPDALYTYPADWDNNPSDYAANLTTSTRISASLPNSCGTGGGGKSWYDHLFISPSLVNGSRRIKYIANSYHTVANDGNRTGISVNDLPANTSATTSVIQAIYQMSNKYPIIASFEIDTLSTTNVENIGSNYSFTICYPIAQQILRIKLNEFPKDQLIRIVCTDMLGHIVTEQTQLSLNDIVQVPFNASSGLYILNLYCNNSIVGKMLFTQ